MLFFFFFLAFEENVKHKIKLQRNYKLKFTQCRIQYKQVVEKPADHHIIKEDHFENTIVIQEVDPVPSQSYAKKGILILFINFLLN